MALPKIELMQPTLLPRAFHREGWVFEEKIDGWRMLAFKDGDNVRLVSRPGRDYTKRFTALVNAVRGLAPETLILDGEVAIRGPRWHVQRDLCTVLLGGLSGAHLPVRGRFRDHWISRSIASR